MIYYYKVRIEFYKGKERILKDYEVDFLLIGKLFIHLETKHKDNYKVIWILLLKIINYSAMILT